jgi:hypothetical protein
MNVAGMGAVGRGNEPAIPGPGFTNFAPGMNQGMNVAGPMGVQYFQPPMQPFTKNCGDYSESEEACDGASAASGGILNCHYYGAAYDPPCDAFGIPKRPIQYQMGPRTGMEMFDPRVTRFRQPVRRNGITALDDDLDTSFEPTDATGLAGLRRIGIDRWANKMVKLSNNQPGAWFLFLPLFLLREYGGAYTPNQLPATVKSKLSYIKGFIETNKLKDDSIDDVIRQGIGPGIVESTGRSVVDNLTAFKNNPPDITPINIGSALSGLGQEIELTGDDVAGIWMTIKDVWASLKSIVPSWEKDLSKAMGAMMFYKQDWQTVFGITPVAPGYIPSPWFITYRPGNDPAQYTYYWKDKQNMVHQLPYTYYANPEKAQKFGQPLLKALQHFGYNFRDFTPTNTIPPNVVELSLS